MAETDSIFARAGFSVDRKDKPAQAPADDATAATPEKRPGGLFESAGFRTSASQPPAAPASNIPTPERFEAGWQAQGGQNPAPKSTLQKIHEAIDPATLLTTGATNAYHDTLENAAAGWARVKHAFSKEGGSLLPSAGAPETKTVTIHGLTGDSTFPQTVYPNASPGRLLEGGAGLLSTVGAPITATTGAFIEQPVSALTGNPQIGARVADVANILLPTKGGSKAAAKVGPSNKAVNALVDAIGPENVPEVVAGMRSNPRMTPADLSDPVRLTTQGLMAGGTPDVQNFVAKTVRDRNASRIEAANTAFTEAMGPAPDVVKMVEGLKQRAQDAGAQLIQPAIENAQPIAIKPLLSKIDRMIGSPEAIAGETPRIPLTPTQVRLLNLRREITTGEMAPLNERVGLSVGSINDALKTGGMSEARTADFTEARRLLNSARRGNTSEEDLVKGLKNLADKQKIVGPIDEALKMIKKGPTELRGADFLHDVQSRLREEAQAMSKSSTGSDRLMSRDLFDARDKIVDAIDKSTGGQYRPGLAKYREAKQIHESFDEGFDVLKNRSGVNGLEDRPEALRAWMKTATPEEVVAKRIGVRADIDQKINGVKNGALAGETVTAIPYNREKLTTLFGDKEAGRLIRVMDDARREAETSYAIAKGSKTAETEAAKKRIEVHQVGGGNPLQYVAPVAAELIGQSAGIPFLGLAGSVAGKGVLAGVQKGLQITDRMRNMAFARNALATGTGREATINALLSHPKVVRELQKRSNALIAP
jgi:hypothetical protein